MSYDNTTGNRLFYHQSLDQSVVAASSASGTFVEGYSYSAFGERKIFDGNGNERTSSLISDRFGFQGQLYDPLTATYSMRARHYVPAWGRSASPDPLSFAAAPSLYSFTGSRPLANRDPLGLLTNPANACQRDPKACGLVSGSEQPQPPPFAGGDGGGVPPPQAGDGEVPGGGGGGGGGAGSPQPCAGGTGPKGASRRMETVEAPAAVRVQIAGGGGPGGTGVGSRAGGLGGAFARARGPSLRSNNGSPDTRFSRTVRASQSAS